MQLELSTFSCKCQAAGWLPSHGVIWYPAKLLLNWKPYVTEGALRGLCPDCATHVVHGFTHSSIPCKSVTQICGLWAGAPSDPCLHRLTVYTLLIHFSSSGVKTLSRCYDKWAAPGCPQALPTGPDPEQEGCRTVQDSRVPAAPCQSWLSGVGAVRGLPGKSLGEDSDKPGV